MLKWRDGDHASRSLFWTQWVVVVAFLILLGRLWQLQVLGGEKYFRKSQHFVKERAIKAVRGQLYDRSGKILADNRPSYQVQVHPSLLTTETVGRLQQIFKLDAVQMQAVRDRMLQKRDLDRLGGMIIADDASRDQIGLIESSRLELPGVNVLALPRRIYPYGTLGAHAVGYLNQITAQELSEQHDSGYQLGDSIGRAGLERQWESFLRGKDGVERMVVDAKGRRQSDVETPELLGGPPRTEPEPGDRVITTLDVELERVVERALRKHPSAAAAVVEVETGRVLALSSWPEFDPNLVSGHMSAEAAKSLEKRPGRPLVDKTVRENYFPGSTFKIVPALAALEEHLVNPELEIICHGVYHLGKRAFHCVEPHGRVDLHQALSQSCNVYFFGLAEAIGVDRMAKVAAALGFGAPTGLGINGEAPGFLPTVAYYNEHGGYQKGHALNTSIGQGSVKVTVLQLAMAYAAIANGGQLYVPQIVERVETASGKLVEAFPPKLRHQLLFSQGNLAMIRDALAAAVNEKKGTSFAARAPGLSVAGKTGTAQVNNHRIRGVDEGSLQADHAWFASYAPIKSPEIAVVVLIEHGGFGARVATPTAMEIYRGYFRLQRERRLQTAKTARIP